jgi:hypothetical protein
VFIAKMLNYTPSELFKAAESDKQDIDVEF